jgi:type IV fimbrial biogenesis protein FimT
MRGLTLLELLVGLLVASVLLAIAVPAWSAAVARAQAESARVVLFASLTRAINHATATGVEVVLCPGAPTGCRDTVDWSSGWIAYADLDGDRRRGPGETLLDHRAAFEDEVHLRSTAGRKRIIVHPGGGTSGSNATFTLCDAHARTRAVTLVLANSGRLRPAAAKPAAAQACQREIP